MKQSSKYIAIFFAGVFIATAGTSYAAGALKSVKAYLRSDIKISVNGKKLDTSPITYNNSNYLPLRKVAEAVGGEVELSSDGKSINIVTESAEQIASEEPTPSQPLDTEVSESTNEVHDGYLQLRPGAETIGISINDIEYDPTTKTISFKKTNIFIKVQEAYSDGCDAFIGKLGQVYIEKSILVEAKRQIDS